MPIQDCDVLLHEAGAPPIHTPLSVLQALPEKVKERLYVVHTAAIPADCGLRVAPTGTVGTIRLDSAVHDRIQNKLDLDMFLEQIEVREISLQNGTNPKLAPLRDNDTSNPHSLLHRFDGEKGPGNVVPLVFLRPTDVSDAWFILNLLSAVPFLSSLSYAHTMDILEIAQVEVYSSGKIVLEGIRRTEYLCVFWEGTCITKQAFDANKITTVWHAGDWTGPVSLQPDIDRSALAIDDEVLPDIVALSDEGVKVILLKMNDVVRILNAGSKLFRTYAALTEDLEEKNDQGTSFKLQDAVERSSEVMAVIQCNSVLRSLTAMQRRCLESLAEGPRVFSSFSAIWKVGDPVGYAYLIVSGTVTMGRKAAPKMTMGKGRRGSTGAISASSLAAIQEMESNSRSNEGLNPVLTVDSDKLLQNVHPNSEYARLESKLRTRAEDVEVCSELIAGFVDDDDKQRFDAIQAHSDKFANKVLARLYSRRAYTEHLVFSRGNFLSDTSRMVSGVLANAEAARSLRSSITGIMGKDNHCHTSNLVAGPQGCVAMVFPRSTLVPFLDSNPGVLLCLLGTQVVV